MNKEQLFSAAFLKIAQEKVDAFLDLQQGVLTVVLATVDGFEIATATTAQSLESSRIAALASSISTISQVATIETGLGRCSCITLNTDQGVAVLRQLRCQHHDLVWIAVANQHAVLAQVLYYTHQTARELSLL